MATAARAGYFCGAASMDAAACYIPASCLFQVFAGMAVTLCRGRCHRGTFSLQVEVSEAAFLCSRVSGGFYLLSWMTGAGAGVYCEILRRRIATIEWLETKTDAEIKEINQCQ